MNLAKFNEDDSQSDHSKCIGDFNLATEHGNDVLSKLGFVFPCELQKRVLQPFDNARKTEMAAVLPELCTQASVIFKDAIEIFEDGLIDVSSADHPFQASANELVGKFVSNGVSDVDSKPFTSLIGISLASLRLRHLVNMPASETTKQIFNTNTDLIAKASELQKDVLAFQDMFLYSGRLIQTSHLERGTIS